MTPSCSRASPASESALKYLDYETVIAINAEHGGAGAGVISETGIRAQLGRAEASFGGVEQFPTVAEKAAVLLHGLASTQYFHDGNKRTAWLVAKLFLAINGHLLRATSTVEAEAFVLTIATKAFERDDQHAGAIAKAAEWFEARRLRASDRLDYVILSSEASWIEDTDTFRMEGGNIGAMAINVVPHVLQVFVTVHTLFHPDDVYEQWDLRITTESDRRAFQLIYPAPSFEAALMRGEDPPPDRTNWDLIHEQHVSLTALPDLSGHHSSGVRPSLTIVETTIDVLGPGRGYFVLHLNGEEYARKAFNVDVVDVDWDGPG